MKGLKLICSVHWHIYVFEKLLKHFNWNSKLIQAQNSIPYQNQMNSEQTKMPFNLIPIKAGGKGV